MSGIDSPVRGLQSQNARREFRKPTSRGCLLIAAVLFLSLRYAPAQVVDRIVAQVNDDIITLSDMKRTMAQLRQELATRYSGEQLEQELKKAEKDVLEELITQKLLLQKAEELGFGANIEVQVSAAVEKIRTDNKLKDMEELERALAAQGMDMAGLRDQIRKRILTESLINEFVASRITLLTPEIEKYYKDHAQDYSTPEEVTLSEILIPVGLNDAEAKARIEDVYKRAKAGDSFASLASQYSKGTTASKGGGIGSYDTSKLNAEVARAVAGVKEGEISEIAKIGDSYAIFRVDSRKEATIRPLEEVRDEIRDRLWQQKFTPEYNRYVTQLREDAYVQIFGEAEQ